MFFEITENKVHLAIDKTSKGTLVLAALDASVQPALPVPEDSSSVYSLANVRLSGFCQLGCHIAKYIDSSLTGEWAPVYKEHQALRNSLGLHLSFTQSINNIDVISEFQFFDGVSAVSCRTTIVNHSESSLGIEAMAGICINRVLPVSVHESRNVDLCALRGGWAQEFEMDRRTLEEWGIRKTTGLVFRKASLSNCGSFACKEYYPIGLLEDKLNHCGVAWQIECCSNWYWEISESYQKNIYLYLSGGNDREHHCYRELQPGESLTTPECTLAPYAGDCNDSWPALTACRRRKRMTQPKTPVIFNDYMTLWANPSTEKNLPVIRKAGHLGAEIYLIDAGWYGKGTWWNEVGMWIEEPSRFPNGLQELTAEIRACGMQPGLWLEIERMGKNCPLASVWPDECFFCRNGRRVMENDSYQLDFRHPMVRNHIQGTVERLISDLGIRFFKFDYNIEIGPGTDINASSPGDGLELHQQAYLEWFDAFRGMHPEIGFENCASGGMRNTQPYLSRCNVCSMSDNINLIETTRIALNAALALVPEQCSVWVAPRKDSSIHQLAAALSAALLLNPLLSGDVLEFSEMHEALMKEATALYKSDLREFLVHSSPWYPMGIPEPNAETAIWGMRNERRAVIGVWNFRQDESEITFELPHSWNVISERMYFPSDSSNGFECHGDEIRIRLPGECGCLLNVEYEKG